MKGCELKFPRVGALVTLALMSCVQHSVASEAMSLEEGAAVASLAWQIHHIEAKYPRYRFVHGVGALIPSKLAAPDSSGVRSMNATPPMLLSLNENGFNVLQISDRQPPASSSQAIPIFRVDHLVNRVYLRGKYAATVRSSYYAGSLELAKLIPAKLFVLRLKMHFGQWRVIAWKEKPAAVEQ